MATELLKNISTIGEETTDPQINLADKKDIVEEEMIHKLMEN